MRPQLPPWAPSAILEAIEPLTAALNDRYDSVRTATGEALKKPGWIPKKSKPRARIPQASAGEKRAPKAEGSALGSGDPSLVAGNEASGRAPQGSPATEA